MYYRYTIIHPFIHLTTFRLTIKFSGNRIIRIAIYRIVLKTAFCRYYNEKLNIKSRFVSPECIYFMTFILLFLGNCL